MLPQGYASPHQPDLLEYLPSSCWYGVVTLAGSSAQAVVHPTDVWGAGSRKVDPQQEVLVGPRITSANSMSGKLGNPSRSPWKLLPATVGTDFVGSGEPSLVQASRVHRRERHPKGDETRSDGWTTSSIKREPQYYRWLECLWVPEECDLDRLDTLQAGTPTHGN